ncbi:MAG: histidine triad nucleotide-binding protein [Acidobacteria bacterium 13_1_20CM_3_53_8]|nr:MAG: histidine triad nucleotide-binding protein [Acidobacteria bacterium 13_1_20CM_3_53_8]
MENNCLFCRIVAGEIAAEIIYSDERSVAFRDINPQAPTHVLVVPREHIESLDDATQKDEALLGHLLRVAARVANEMGHSESGYRAVINTGAGAGQSVFHLHVHMLGGRALEWPPG